MQCKEVEEMMDLGLDADLSPEEAVLFYGHIHSCSKCAEEYAQLGRLLKEIRHCPSPTAPRYYWNDIWRTVRSRTLHQTTDQGWWMMHRLHLMVAAVPLAAVLTFMGFTMAGNRQNARMTLSEASSRHGIVLMSQPYSDRGLAMLAISEGTLANYENKD